MFEQAMHKEPNNNNNNSNETIFPKNKAMEKRRKKERKTEAEDTLKKIQSDKMPNREQNIGMF